MAQPLNHRVQLGRESTWGQAGSLTAEWPVVGAGFKPAIADDLKEVEASSTYPYTTDQVSMGVSGSLTIEVDANVATIRDIILVASARTSGVLNRFTIVDNQHGVGVAQYLGCVCKSMTLSASRSDVLKVTLTFECFKSTNGTGTLGSLTQGTGHHFAHRHSTIKVNNVEATKVLTTEISLDNGLDAGPVQADGSRMYIQEGNAKYGIKHTAMFDSTAWRVLIEASTAAATNTIVFSTGTASETVTATIATARLRSRGIGSEGSVVSEDIELAPYGASAVAWSFGSSIGASALSLS